MHEIRQYTLQRGNYMEPITLRLPLELREKFKRPWGQLLKKDDEHTPEQQVKSLYLSKNPRILISVGDVCTESLWKVKIFPEVAIIDGVTLRGKYSLKIRPAIQYRRRTVKNPAATITKEAWITICQAIQHAITDDLHAIIMVNGEEDLLTLPAITCSPERGIVVYGQPKEGIVWMEVTTELKNKVHGILSQFHHE